MSSYRGITTMTTVGFGGITPKADVGCFIASLMMPMELGILAVPTGIFTAEITARRIARRVTARRCPDCLTEAHDADARFCRHCGKALPQYKHD